MTTYNPITPEIVAKLAQIVGASNVTLDEDKLEAYSHDETPKDQFSGMPEVIVTPTSTQQVAYRMALTRYLKVLIASPDSRRSRLSAPPASPPPRAVPPPSAGRPACRARR